MDFKFLDLYEELNSLNEEVLQTYQIGEDQYRAFKALIAEQKTPSSGGFVDLKNLFANQVSAANAAKSLKLGEPELTQDGFKFKFNYTWATDEISISGSVALPKEKCKDYLESFYPNIYGKYFSDQINDINDSNSLPAVPDTGQFADLVDYCIKNKDNPQAIYNLKRYLKQNFNKSLTGYKSLQYLYNASVQEKALVDSIEGLKHNPEATTGGKPILTNDIKDDPDLIYKFNGDSFKVDAKIQGSSQNSDNIYTSNSAQLADMLIIFKINGLGDTIGKKDIEGTWHLAINKAKLVGFSDKPTVDNGGYMDYSKDIINKIGINTTLLDAANVLAEGIVWLNTNKNSLKLCKLA